jgi:hypothetical protein
MPAAAPKGSLSYRASIILCILKCFGIFDLTTFSTLISNADQDIIGNDIEMDLQKTIQALRDEKAKLDRVIASLEELAVERAVTAPTSRRGRKSMGAEERAEVSARMKRYWDHRRKHVKGEA